MERTSDVVTSDPLPTVQIDSGYVWSQATVGTTVYAGGSFSNARAALADPGTNLTPRSNILAFDITTGALLPFAPQVNGLIKAVAASPDGSRIYIGGTFTQVNGASRHNFAALDARTGALVPGFAPAVGGTGVYAVAATADAVYVGGLFTQANTVARKNFAAFSTKNGALLPWAPTSDRQVDSMIVEPGAARVIAGGRFDSVNGAIQRGLVALDPVSGGTDASWAAPKTVKNSTPAAVNRNGYSGIFGLTADATAVYGTGWSMGDTAATRGNLEGAFAAEVGSGAIRWVADCHGDSYGVYSTGKTVYTTNHTHTCESANLWPEQKQRTWRYFSAFTATAEGTLASSQFTNGTYSDWGGTPSPSAYAVTPDFAVGTATGLGQAGLSITGSGDFIAVAGEFTSVNNRRFQGIVRFSTKPDGGAAQGPYRKDAAWATPQVASDVPVRVTIETNWDRDNRDLTYQLMRSDQTQPVSQTVATSLWWDKGTVTLEDPTAVAGATYTYTVKAVDADGNSAVSLPVNTTASGADIAGYSKVVRRDGADAYFPLGNARTDYVSAGALNVGPGVTVTASGAVGGATPAGSVFNGTPDGRVSSAAAVALDDNFSAEVWFKTTTRQGGKIFGAGSSQTGSSASNDRDLYMQNDGRLRFGVYPYAGSPVRSVATTSAYNDGQWHHVVATMSPRGTTIYVDGKAAAADESMTAAQKSYNGFWRLGWDGRLSSWPSAPASDAFSGSIDEFAAYPSALNADQVMRHYAAGKGYKAPVASWSTSSPGPDMTFTGEATFVDAGQKIVSAAWDFGDGSTGTGLPTATHTYTAAGTYTVTLTVTDSRGLTGTVKKQAVVTAPNVAPVADFASSVSELTASVDAAGSTDADGTIAAYSWEWGDGTAAGSGAAATHTYAAAGTYRITLTITDDRGGAATKAADVTVAAAAALAEDAFERTATSGWGAADIGGAWTLAGGAASAAAVSGGAGTLTLGAGSTRNLTVNAVSAKNVTMSMDFSLDTPPAQGSTYAGLIARSSASGNYTTRAWLNANGRVSIVIQRGTTVLSSYQVPGITRGAGDAFTLKVDVSGDASTKISAKLWKKGSPEPADWQTSFTDANGIDSAGAVGVHGSRAASASGTGVVSVDAFRVIDNG
ncbi:PKD domain-containing protein [Microbacterium foliorum]|uniref:PKD domain-containing protein n=1 Tax=Microbacterium foliorum TaxID=104336 RepID=UPI0012E09FCB|nr:PKD domain-containing protein [Microbacterium foliorum]